MLGIGGQTTSRQKFWQAATSSLKNRPPNFLNLSNRSCAHRDIGELDSTLHNEHHIRICRGPLGSLPSGRLSVEAEILRCCHRASEHSEVSNLLGDSAQWRAASNSLRRPCHHWRRLSYFSMPPVFCSLATASGSAGSKLRRARSSIRLRASSMVASSSALPG